MVSVETAGQSDGQQGQTHLDHGQPELPLQAFQASKSETQPLPLSYPQLESL